MASAIPFNSGFSPVEYLEEEVENLEINKVMLGIYLRQQAEKIGLDPNSIQLGIANKNGTLECNVLKKIVYVGRDLVQNYGKPDDMLEHLIDRSPDDPKELRDCILQLSPNEVKKIQIDSLKLFSDIELEAALAHELGHIILNHQLKKTDSTMDLYQMELDADAYACRTEKLQKGVIRGFKRAIILEVLTKGDDRKNIHAVVKNHSWSHPSYDMRLSQALSIIPLKF